MLQLLVEQHDVAVPDVGVPVLVAGHVLPAATHEYVLVGVPDAHAEEVLN